MSRCFYRFNSTSYQTMWLYMSDRTSLGNSLDLSVLKELSFLHKMQWLLHTGDRMVTGWRPLFMLPAKI